MEESSDYFELILFFTNNVLFEEVTTEIIGHNVHINGVEWFQAYVNKRELAISIGCGNTAYSKGKSGFQYFLDKAIKYFKVAGLRKEKESKSLRYHISEKEKDLLIAMGEKPEIIGELEKGFKSMEEIIDYANTLSTRSNNFFWYAPKKRSTVSKRINGSESPPYIQPKLPLICVLGIIKPEEAYRNDLAARPLKSQLFSTQGLSKHINKWEVENGFLTPSEKRALNPRFQNINWHSRGIMKLISDEVSHIRFGLDHRKTPVAGFHSKHELQEELGVTQGQVAKILNGADLEQSSIDKRIRIIVIAGKCYTLEDISKIANITKSAAGQRVKRHLGKKDEYSLIFSKKHQAGNTEFQGKAPQKSYGIFYIVYYSHPSIADELIKFGITGKNSTDERLADHPGCIWKDRLIIKGPSELLVELEKQLKQHRLIFKLKQPVVEYTRKSKSRALSGYQDIVLKSEFEIHYEQLLKNPIEFCLRTLSAFAIKKQLDIRALKVDLRTD